MKAARIREFTTVELNERLTELKSELFNLRFQLATGQLENTMAISECKKNIARVQTTLRQRQLKQA